MRTALAIVAIGLSGIAAAAPPLYKQCDSRWGNEQMGVVGKEKEDDTICDQGCAMSSVTMALAGFGIKMDGKAIDPGSMNRWLRSSGGYTCIDNDCCNLVLDAPSRIPGSPLVLIGEKPKPSPDAIREGLESGAMVFVAHVRNNSHFVLLTGSRGAGVFEVNDPFFNETTYEYESISDIIMYSVRRSGPQLRGSSSSSSSWNGPAAAATSFASATGTPRADPSALPPPPVLRSPVIPHAMPLWKQCDPRWGKDLIVTETVCAVGCLMSSTSMAIDGHGIRISNGTGKYTSTPGSLNAFLKKHGGYTQGNDMEESVVPQVDPSLIKWPSDGMHRTNDLSAKQVQDMLRNGRPVIANVMHGEHFVLVTGWDSSNEDTLVVNDPGFDRNTYSLTGDVVGWRLFDMEFAKQ